MVFWIYALVGTAGLVAIVPSILRALDGHDANFARGFIGFAGTPFGAIGSVLSFTDMRWVMTLVLATMFGLAVGAFHMEFLGLLRDPAPKQQEPAATYGDV